jgi:hypothetical protein
MLTLLTCRYAYAPKSGHHPSSGQKFSFAPEDGIQKNLTKHTFRVRNQSTNATIFSTVHCCQKHQTCRWAVIKKPAMETVIFSAPKISVQANITLLRQNQICLLQTQHLFSTVQTLSVSQKAWLWAVIPTTTQV